MSSSSYQPSERLFRRQQRALYLLLICFLAFVALVLCGGAAFAPWALGGQLLAGAWAWFTLFMQRRERLRALAGSLPARTGLSE